MSGRFEIAFAFAMSFEGYKSDDPDDPGGRTIFGISARFWPRIVAELWDLPKAEAYDRAAKFYEREYWLAAGCDTATRPYDVYLFDAAVNIGLERAARMSSLSSGPDDFLFRRIEHYVFIATGKKAKFLRGWVRRVVELRRLT
jgi:lysozyme family protein